MRTDVSSLLEFFMKIDTVEDVLVAGPTLTAYGTGLAAQSLIDDMHTGNFTLTEKVKKAKLIAQCIQYTRKSSLLCDDGSKLGNGCRSLLSAGTTFVRKPSSTTLALLLRQYDQVDVSTLLLPARARLTTFAGKIKREVLNGGQPTPLASWESKVDRKTQEELRLYTLEADRFKLRCEELERDLEECRRELAEKTEELDRFVIESREREQHAHRRGGRDEDEDGDLFDSAVLPADRDPLHIDLFGGLDDLFAEDGGYSNRRELDAHLPVADISSASSIATDGDTAQAQTRKRRSPGDRDSVGNAKQAKARRLRHKCGERKAVISGPRKGEETRTLQKREHSVDTEVDDVGCKRVRTPVQTSMALSMADLLKADMQREKHIPTARRHPTEEMETVERERVRDPARVEQHHDQDDQLTEEERAAQRLEEVREMARQEDFARARQEADEQAAARRGNRGRRSESPDEQPRGFWAKWRFF